jgi:hypothetical protein
LLDHLFEGDIVNVNKKQLEGMHNALNPFARNAVNTKRALWPNSIVPYVISSAYNSYERSVIASGIKEYHKKTCIK